MRLRQHYFARSGSIGRIGTGPSGDDEDEPRSRLPRVEFLCSVSGRSPRARSGRARGIVAGGGGPEECIPAGNGRLRGSGRRVPATPECRTAVASGHVPDLAAGRQPLQDLFIGDFVDLDPTPGILAWNCSAHTRNGHAGPTRSSVRSASRHRRARLRGADGVVAATQDGLPRHEHAAPGQPSNFVIISHPGAASRGTGT